MSSPSSDWAKFYQQNLSGQAQTKPAALFTTSNQVSDATMVTTNSTSSSLCPEGRVSKPIRRRSRASRRTPTTLLNTDTANFRAMVQQFTGGPVNSLYPSGTNFNLGMGNSQQIGNPNAVMVPRAGYNILQLQQQQFHQQQYMLSRNNNNNNTFLERLQSSRVAPMMDVSGTGGWFGMGMGMGMEGVSSSVPPIRSSSSNKNITSEDNYMSVRRT